MRRGAALILTMFFAVGLLAGRAEAGRRVALVVGNAGYALGHLSHSANNARLMAEVLRERGFDLVDGEALIDLDKPALDRAVRRFVGELQGADVGLFYYAGHALNVDDTNYLLPVGVDPTSSRALRDETIDVGALLGQMEAAGTQLKLLILDASRADPFGGNLRATAPGLARIDAPANSIIVFAAQPGQVADDGRNEYSIFTQALADAMRKSGLNAFELFREVDTRVQGPTGGVQRPWVMINAAQAGQFYIADPSPAAANPVATVPPAARPAAPPEAPPRAAPKSPAQGAPPASSAKAPTEQSTPQKPQPAERNTPKKSDTRQPPPTKQVAVPKSSPPASAPAGRCRSIQALCALEIGGCCDQATGQWQYGRNGCGGSAMAHNNCISRRLATQK